MHPYKTQGPTTCPSCKCLCNCSFGFEQKDTKPITVHGNRNITSKCGSPAIHLCTREIGTDVLSFKLPQSVHLFAEIPPDLISLDIHIWVFSPGPKPGKPLHDLSPYHCNQRPDTPPFIHVSADWKITLRNIGLTNNTGGLTYVRGSSAKLASGGFLQNP